MDEDKTIEEVKRRNRNVKIKRTILILSIITIAILGVILTSNRLNTNLREEYSPFFSIVKDALIFNNNYYNSTQQTINNSKSIWMNVTDNNLIFYDGFDLPDFNDTHNITYDYTKNGINGSYESSSSNLNTTFYNQTGGLFGGAGQVNSLTQGGDSCVDPSCTKYAVIRYGNVSQLQFNMTNPNTISFWFYPKVMSQTKATRLVSYYGELPNDASYSGWEISYSNYTVGGEVPANSIEYCYSYGPGSFRCAGTDANTVKFNQWNHVVFNYNGTNSFNARRIWLNGIEYTNYRGPGVIVNANYTENYTVDTGYGTAEYEWAKFRIGNYQYGTYTEASQFLIDELLIYNTSLSNVTIQNIYHNISNRFPIQSNVTYVQNLSGWLKANITLANCEQNFSSNLSVRINNGNITQFVKQGLACKVTDYNLMQDRQNANVSIQFFSGNGSYNNFITPVIKNNITIDLYDLNFLNVTFNSQIPFDIDSTNVYNTLNVTYNITSGSGLNLSTIELFHKNNDTTDDINDYVNGTARVGWEKGILYNSNLSSTFFWALPESHIYPSTYNIDQEVMDNTIHQVLTLSLNEWSKTTVLNVSNSSAFNIWEVMVNASTSANNLQFYYCNSSYVSGIVTLPSESNCINFYTMSPSPSFNNTNNQSMHKEIPMIINVTTGQVGSVKVTSTSSLLIRGSNGANRRYVYYIPNTVRVGASQTSTTNGATWTNQTYTFDTHLDQFHNESLYYYACANDTANPINHVCSNVRQDAYQTGGLPPTGLVVYSPSNATYTINSLISINYTMPDSQYPISFYNISLMNNDSTFNKTIVNNNSINLSYAWDSTGTAIGNYTIRVTACDTLNQCSSAFSEEFEIGGQPLSVVIVTPSNITYGANWINPIVTTSISATVNYTIDGGITNTTLNANASSTGFTGYQSGLSDGNYVMKVNAIDTSGNINNTVNVTFKINSNPLQLNLTIRAENGGRFSLFTAETFNTSKENYDNRDSVVVTSSSNYTQYKSSVVLPTQSLDVDVFNTTSLPRTFNITYFSNPAMVGTFNLSWNGWNQANYNAILTDYGTDNTYTTNVTPSISLKDVVNYIRIINSTTNNYFKLRVELT